MTYTVGGDFRTIGRPKLRGFEKVSEEQWQKDAVKLGIVEQLDALELPVRKTSKSSGYDILSPIDFILYPKQEILLPLGFKVYMLDDEFLGVYPRSKLGFKYYFRLANTVGIIDSDYYDNIDNEGHCFAKMRNESETELLIIKKGEGIAQAIFQKFLLVDGDNFTTGNIREGGIGSTDKK